MKPMPRESVRGFTLLEVMMGSVIGALVLAGGYRLWISSQWENQLLRKKSDLRDQMAMSSKRIQRSVTLAGLGLSRVPILIKDDALGSDTLTLYSNPGEKHTQLQWDILSGGTYRISVKDASSFVGSPYMAITDDRPGELRKVVAVEGSMLVLDQPLTRSYAKASAVVSPVRQEKYFTDQDAGDLICRVDGRKTVLARDIQNFQVSFRDGAGENTEIPGDIRTVVFSFTGRFPAKDGALSSVIFSSTAIPRNTL